MNAVLEHLIRSVSQLRDHALALEAKHQSAIAQASPAYRESARNLLHYLALRQHDIRHLQDELASLGLSSLGRSESHVMHSLHGVLTALHALLGQQAALNPADVPTTFRSGNQLLEEHTQRLFGTPSGKRNVRIMVTMPSFAARDGAFVRELLAAGMDVMRINCAHDSPGEWLMMIEHLRRAERELGRSCKIYLDLAGPKLRTGPLAPFAYVIKSRPVRDVRGCVITPARVHFAPSPAQADPLLPLIPLEGDIPAHAQVGDTLLLKDARGRNRRFHITSVGANTFVAECDRTTYFETGGVVRLLRDGQTLSEGRIGPLPPVFEPITLRVGDTLLITNDTVAGRSAQRNSQGQAIKPAHISCTLGEAFRNVAVGESIWFDDGKIGGRVLSNDGHTMRVEITHCRAKGGKLGPEKGINLPDSWLELPALTDKDRADLALMAHRVDMVGLSFVREPQDVLTLAHELQRLDASHVGIVLKIETRRAFENLPRLLLAGMQTAAIGVMVARGDLAVEVGFERLAEVQEEILWLCEAAHVPVIWATQVLESLAKGGAPSRAEVSDAVMSGRAECVMLNKGDYVIEAVHFLSGVLERMAAHQTKKRSRLRRLAIAQI